MDFDINQIEQHLIIRNFDVKYNFNVNVSL